MRHCKRGQAALEFLTTYGWAFLVILIVMGALAYFGVTSPQDILPDRCNIVSEFQCLDYLIDATNSEIKLRLSPNLGSPIRITNIVVKSDTGEALCNNNTGWTVTPRNVSNYQIGDCSMTSFGIVEGEKAKILLDIYWYDLKSGSAYEKRGKADIFSIVT